MKLRKFSESILRRFIRKIILLSTIISLLFFLACEKKSSPPPPEAAKAPVDFSGTWYLRGLYGFMKIEQTSSAISITLVFNDNQPLGPYVANIDQNTAFIPSELSLLLTDVNNSVFSLSEDNETIHADMRVVNTNAFSNTNSTAIKNVIFAKKITVPEQVMAWDDLRNTRFANALQSFIQQAGYYPNNPYVLFGEIKCLLALNKANDALAVLKSLKSMQPPIEKDDFLKYALMVSETNIKSMISMNENRNAFADFMQAMSSFPDQNQTFPDEFIPIIQNSEELSFRLKRKYDDYFRPYTKSMNFLKTSSQKSDFIFLDLFGKMPDSQQSSILAKVFILQGKALEQRQLYNEAMIHYGNAIIIGQHLSKYRYGVKLMGIEYREYATECLNFLLNKKLQNPRDIEQFIQLVRVLISNDKPIVYNEYIKFDPPIGKLPDFYNGWIIEESIRTKLKLIEISAAAKLKRINTNRFPRSDNELIPEFLPQIYKDEFSGEPLKYYVDNEGSFIIYSVGPDKVDNKGKVIFDYKRGINSAGDIAYSQY